jgi:hypothetical protein
MHVLFTHAGVVPAHEWPHVPQLKSSFVRLVSQPVAGLPSQSPKPVWHDPAANPHVPAVQVAVALSTPVHCIAVLHATHVPKALHTTPPEVHAVPSLSKEHVPEEHVRHALVQAWSQQTPPAQWVLVHWASRAHTLPSVSFVTQRLPLQKKLGGQSLSTEQPVQTPEEQNMPVPQAVPSVRLA